MSQLPQQTPVASHRLITDSEMDNIRRGLRTGIQGIGGFVAAGGLNEVWQHWLSDGHHEIPSFWIFVIGIALTGVAGWAQNTFEDRTGKSLLSPTDRKVGDQTLDTGLGSKSPVAPVVTVPPGR